MVVHVDAAVLADPAAPGQTVLEDGARVPAGTSQRLACDASRPAGAPQRAVCWLTNACTFFQASAEASANSANLRSKKL